MFQMNCKLAKVVCDVSHSFNITTVNRVGASCYKTIFLLRLMIFGRPTVFYLFWADYLSMTTVSFVVNVC